MATEPSVGKSAPLESQDLQVLRAAEAWHAEGRRVWLATVVETYGSAPRPVGSMAVMNDLGQVIGSVSGGCVEDDLTEWLLRDASASARARSLVYGRDAEERARLRLPCNGHLRVWLEPVPLVLIRELRQAVDQGRLMCRALNLRSGGWTIFPARADAVTTLEGDSFMQVIGPTMRLTLIGASEVSRHLAPMAMGLGFRVTVVDPRPEYLGTWPHAGCELLDAMPDEAIAANPPDQRTAIVALSHDPKLDDMALLEALKSQAFYIGAMGSVRTTEARKERLALFDLQAHEIGRLRGPVGMDIGARTPPEIAISIAADLIRVVRNDRPCMSEDGEVASPVHFRTTALGSLLHQRTRVMRRDRRPLMAPLPMRKRRVEDRPAIKASHSETGRFGGTVNRRWLVAGLLGSVATITDFAALAAGNARPNDESSNPTARIMKIRIDLEGTVVTATLADGEASRDFVSLLPLNLTLKDYASTEKISDLPKALSSHGAPASIKPLKGDICYYAPWGNLALFYRDGKQSPGLVKLGSFESGIDALSRPGPMRARVELIK